MQRLRTVTLLDVSAVAGHHAMPAALLLNIIAINLFHLDFFTSCDNYKSKSKRAYSQIPCFAPKTKKKGITSRNGTQKFIISSEAGNQSVCYRCAFGIRNFHWYRQQNQAYAKGGRHALQSQF